MTRYIPETGWGITVNIDQDEVFQPIRDLQNLLLILFFISLLIAIIFSVIFSHQITHPILELTETTLKISQGNYQDKLKINSQDEIGQLAKAFNEMTENLLRSNQELKEEIITRKNIEAEMEKFTYVSSHDLQEPLRTITSFSQLLEKKYKGKIDTEAQEYIDFIIIASVKMKNLISDLLSYSKISYEAKDFNQVDFNKITDYVISALKPDIEKSGAEIKFDTLPVVRANYIQMIQLLKNLVQNSLKFKDQRKPEIHISAKNTNNEWLFTVSDNGIGIEKQYFNKVFVPFQQLSKQYEGTGLGLTICRKIIEIHNGKIWIESEEGKGSTFYFTLPV